MTHKDTFPLKRKIQESITQNVPIKGFLWVSLQSFDLDANNDIKPLFDKWLAKILEVDRSKTVKVKEGYHLNDLDDDIEYIKAAISCGDLPDQESKFFFNHKEEKEEIIYSLAAHIAMKKWKWKATQARATQEALANEKKKTEQIDLYKTTSTSPEIPEVDTSPPTTQKTQPTYDPPKGGNNGSTPSQTDTRSFVPEWLKQKPTQEPCFFVIIITAEKIPKLQLPCPEGWVGIEVNTGKTLIQESRKIKIAKSKAELEESLKELKLGDCNDLEKIKNEAGNSNVLIVLMMWAKIGVEKKTTKVEILANVEEKPSDKPKITSIYLLESVKGTQTFIQ